MFSNRRISSYGTNLGMATVDICADIILHLAKKNINLSRANVALIMLETLSMFLFVSTVRYKELGNNKSINQIISSAKGPLKVFLRKIDEPNPIRNRTLKYFGIINLHYYQQWSSSIIFNVENNDLEKCIVLATDKVWLNIQKEIRNNISMYELTGTDAYLKMYITSIIDSY